MAEPVIRPLSRCRRHTNGAFAGLLAASLAGCAPPAATPQAAAMPPPGRVWGPAYTAAQMRRLTIRGVHLGMEQRAACERLLAQGFYSHEGDEPDEVCAAEAMDRHEGRFVYFPSYNDTFFPGPKAKRDPNAGRPGALTGKLSSLTLEYARTRDDRLIVSGMSALTDEPNQEEEALARSTVAAWGTPTVNHLWGHLVYGSSVEQADYENRGAFTSCKIDPGCEHLDGIDCAAILSRYSTVSATVNLNGWGRYIHLDDNGSQLSEGRRNGVIRRRPWTVPGGFIRSLCRPKPRGEKEAE